jgi:hypothetical protein
MQLEAGLAAMQRSLIARTSRAATLGAAGLLALFCGIGQAQNPPPLPLAPSGSAERTGAVPLNDALLARATALYDSTAKSGVHGFDCALHVDWKKVMSSARKGAAVADDDPKLVLVNPVQITLHARLGGKPTLDWRAPEGSGDAVSKAVLDEVHRGVEQTLLSTLKLWTPLVDGSVAESLGEEDVDVAETTDGYTLRSGIKQQGNKQHGDKQREDKQQGNKQPALTEQFDRNLLLKHFVAVDAGSTADIEPVYQPGAAGLLLSGFLAHLQPAGAAGQAAQEMRVSIDYQTVSGRQIPAHITIDLPNIVEMDFTLDGCIVNPASK